MGLRQLAFFTLLILMVTACSPEPVFRLTPEKGPSTFHKGIEYITLEEDGIAVTMAYYSHMKDMFALDIEVYNNSDKPIRVDPANFGYSAFEHYSDSALSDFITHHRAFDPEDKLLEIDKNISRHYAAQKTEGALFLTAVGVGVAAAIIAGPDDDGSRDDDDDHIEYHYVEHNVRSDGIDYELMDLEQKREIWELETLRITDLQPEDYIRGLVFFPNEPDASGYEFELEIKDLKFLARYEQHKIEP